MPTRSICILASILTITGMADAKEDLSLMPGTGPSNLQWQALGDAFKQPLVTGKTLDDLEIENAGNASVLSSERDGDGPRGTFTSDPFTIERDYLSFRIGGGAYEHFTCLDLIVDGKVVRKATGFNSDRLTPLSWDVRKFAGKTAHLRLTDNASGHWGHINVASIAQTDHPERPPEPTAPLYREALRPQFHFTARQWTMNRLNPREHQEGWINDLNGLIFYDGEWHLFAQRWASCWLHAVSKDLVHWTELPPAFWEEEAGSGTQSGTCVIDYGNTSGLSPDPNNPPMVAFWSRFDNKSQCISYSLDRGRTWKHYDKNPIFEKRERDPKVFWYAPGKHWVMIMYGDDAYHLLNSPNLLDWTDTGNPLPNSFECPDFFELPLDGDASKKKWVLIQGNGNYSIGTFDGKKFTEETPRRQCDPGNFYATQSWHNTDTIPGTGDGRRVQVAWMRGAFFPDMPFCQMISFPCELSLRSTADGLRIFRKPIEEVESLHGTAESWNARMLDAGKSIPIAQAGREFHLKAEVNLPADGTLVFNIRGTEVILTRDSVRSGEHTLPVLEAIRSVELLIDRTSVEIFVNDGEVSLTRFVLMNGNGLSVSAQNAQAEIHSMTLWPMKSAWPETADE